MALKDSLTLFAQPERLRKPQFWLNLTLQPKLWLRWNPFFLPLGVQLELAIYVLILQASSLQFTLMIRSLSFQTIGLSPMKISCCNEPLRTACHSVFCRSGTRPFPPSSILNHSCAPRYTCLFGAMGER